MATTRRQFLKVAGGAAAAGAIGFPAVARAQAKSHRSLQVGRILLLELAEGKYH